MRQHLHGLTGHSALLVRVERLADQFSRIRCQRVGTELAQPLPGHASHQSGGYRAKRAAIDAVRSPLLLRDQCLGV
ncbi:hypothetical protein D3C71_1698560 [compost metagenome]